MSAVKRGARLRASSGLAALLVFLLAGCSAGGFRPAAPQPGRTTLPASGVTLPAELIGNLLVVEVPGDRSGPRRFLVDTGSSVTLVTPEIARRSPGRGPVAAGGAPLRVKGAEGAVVELPRASLRRLDLGAARFEDVDVVIHDCAAISAHLGRRIDGVLGFPLFREVLLTLDYPGRQVSLRPATGGSATRGVALRFDDARKVPLVSAGLGGRTLMMLVDSGSDAVFSLNPAGFRPDFAHGPVRGTVVGTLAGEREQEVGRLAGDIAIGEVVFTRPRVDFTDELSALGGGALRHFTVTFDQLRDRVVLERAVSGPVETPALRSSGLSFSRTPAYWRIAGVVPGSPAERAGVERGELIVRIDGEPVSRWDLSRFEARVGRTEELEFTFLEGNREITRRVRVFDLVP
jgi:Aspartyl protease/PDZ domain